MAQAKDAERGTWFRVKKLRLLPGWASLPDNLSKKAPCRVEYGDLYGRIAHPNCGRHMYAAPKRALNNAIRLKRTHILYDLHVCSLSIQPYSNLNSTSIER